MGLVDVLVVGGGGGVIWDGGFWLCGQSVAPQFFCTPTDIDIVISVKMTCWVRST